MSRYAGLSRRRGSQLSRYILRHHARSSLAVSAHFAPFRVGNITDSTMCSACSKILRGISRSMALAVLRLAVCPGRLATSPSTISVLVPLASPVIPTPMEERLLQYCSENEEGYTAECGHCSELHMTIGLRHELVGRHDGLTIATCEEREKGGIAFKRDRSRGHH
jgi:hypothetical protein